MGLRGQLNESSSELLIGISHILDMFYLNILSLDRSRSTISTKYLAIKAGGIGLGEVARCISPKSKEKDNVRSDSTCSCGKKLSVCGFWSNIILTSNREEAFFNYVSKSNYLVIDSSKTIKHSKNIRLNIDSKKTFCIVLLRSFTSWSNSVQAAAKRNGEGDFKNLFLDSSFILSSLRLFLRRFYIFRAYEYFITNIRLIHESNQYCYSAVVTNSSQMESIATYLSNKHLYDTIEKSFNHIPRGNRVSFSDVSMKDWSESSISIRFITTVSSILNILSRSFKLLK